MLERISNRTATLAGKLSRLIEFETRSTWALRSGEPGIADFTFGNPHEMPLAGFVEALQTWSTPQAPDWFAYTMSEPAAQEAVAAALRRQLDLPFEPADIALTTGSFGALAIALKAVTDPGDEVIFSLPPWLAYEALIVEAGLVPVKVRVDPATFDLDLDAIAAAITLRTRVVIVNTPNHPTGKIYPPSTLRRLAGLLTEASARNGRPIFILSDEPYRRIVFDGRSFFSPAAYYPHTLIAYSYGKVLLTPGERIGYLALSPSMPDRDAVRESVLITQIASGWAFPNAVLQRALADLEGLSIDVDRLQYRRDWMARELQAMGYQVHVPEATFYLLCRSPWRDDDAFAELLARYDVFVLPGSLFEMPGYFRISLTANDEMVERGLRGFAAAMEYALTMPIGGATLARV